jgi:hypothetical protein
MQRLLNFYAWDADQVRDDLRGYVLDRLGDPAGVVVATNFVDVRVGMATPRSDTTCRACGLVARLRATGSWETMSAALPSRRRTPSSVADVRGRSHFAVVDRLRWVAACDLSDAVGLGGVGDGLGGGLVGEGGVVGRLRREVIGWGPLAGGR